MVVSFLKEVAKQEVSCRIARMILKFAEMNDIPAEQLLRGTGANLPYLFEPTNWTGENVILKLFQNLSSALGKEDADHLCGRSVRVLMDDELFDLIFSMSPDPSIFYRNMPKWFALHVKTSELRLVKEQASTVAYQLQGRQGKSLSAGMLRWLEGVLEGGSCAFNLPPARTAIKPPASSPVRLHSIEVAWQPSDRPAVEKAPDGSRAELIVRKIFKRIEKSESKKVDLERLSFLLKESEGRFRTFFDTVMEAVLIIDEGGFIFEANRKTLVMLQCDREDLVGLPAAKLVGPDEEDLIVGLLQIARQGRPIPMIDLDLTRNDGTRIPVQISASSVVWPESSAPFKILLMVRDVSSLRQSEDEARRMRGFNETIVRGMLEGIYVEDAEGICQFANPRMEEMLGYAPGELKGMHWTQLAPDDLIKPIEDELIKRRMGIKNSYEAHLKKKDGSSLPVKISALPLFEQGSFAGVLSVVIDLADVRKIIPELK